MQTQVRLAIAAVLAIGSLFSNAQTFTPTWSNDPFSRIPGLNYGAWATLIFDFGNGPVLVAGGDFSNAGNASASRVTFWDGNQWSPLGAGLSYTVNALATYSFNGLNELYAAGAFTGSGGSTVNRIARWDGIQWQPLGNGLNGTVYSLCAYDDGDGPALYAGGSFTSAGEVAALGIARWDGTQWTSVPGGGLVGGTVYSLAVYDDGTGAGLYAGGTFTAIESSIPANRLARYMSGQWSEVGGGVAGDANAEVDALAVYDHYLYVGGRFTTAGTLNTKSIARWNGANWSSIGGAVLTGTPAYIYALKVIDDGFGEQLYVGGLISQVGTTVVSNIARWNGIGWSRLTGDVAVSNTVASISGIGTGPNFQLFATGWMSYGIIQWVNSVWSSVGTGMNGRVYAMESIIDPNGPVLYAGGTFSMIDTLSTQGIAAWTGNGWDNVGGGMNGPVNALTQFDDGAGKALFAAGGFTNAGGVPANRIARWNGVTWSPLAGGVSGTVKCLEAIPKPDSCGLCMIPHVATHG